MLRSRLSRSKAGAFPWSADWETVAGTARVSKAQIKTRRLKVLWVSDMVSSPEDFLARVNLTPAGRWAVLEETWMAQDLKRAMILIGGLDEEVAQRIAPHPAPPAWRRGMR